MSLVSYKIDANASKAVAAFSKIGQKQEEVAAKIRKTTKATKEETNANKQSKSSLDGVLTSFTGINNAAQLVSNAIAEINAGMERFDTIAKKSGGDFATEKSIRKKFATIAGGDQKRFDELNKLAREISQREGIPFVQAGESVFTGTSGGFTPDEIRSITKLNRIADDPKFAFETAKAFRSQFGKKAGSAGQILNKVLAASEDSRVGFEAIGGAAARAAGSFRQLGGSSSKLLAGLSVIAEGNPAKLDQQTSQLDALARQLAKDKRFKGLGFIGSLKKLKGLVGSGKSLQGILLESEAVKGGSLALENLPEIEKRLKRIDQAAADAGTSRSRINTVHLRITTDCWKVVCGLGIW